MWMDALTKETRTVGVALEILEYDEDLLVG